jgi:hypothetical protein
MGTQLKMIDYQKQGQDFLTETATTLTVEFKEYGFHFADDKDKRDIYKITLRRGSRSYMFDFGQSLADSSFKLLRNNQEIKYSWFDKLTFNQDRDEVKLKYDLREGLGQPVLNKNYGTVVKNRKLHPSLLKIGDLEIKAPIAPSAYDVLACLTKYDPSTFEDFCDSYGYDKDSRKAEKIYFAVVEEYQNLKMLFTDAELEKLAEIN